VSPRVPDPGRAGRGLAALLAGGALGIATEVGGALLLYSGLGLLSAAGFILGVALAALAAGLWVGAPEAPAGENEAAPSAARWILAVVALLFAAIYAAGWESNPRLRDGAPGRAVAVLLLVAWPAYSLGALLGTLEERARLAAGVRHAARTGLAALAALGAAGGVAWAGMILIPRLSAAYVLGACAATLAFVATFESRRRFDGAERSAPMRGKTAIVTGVGARGQVGFAIAGALLRAGARVLVTGRGAEVEALAAELAAGGHDVAAVRADLASQAGAEAVAAAARQRFGRLDALVNVAGGLSVVKPLAETEEAEWSRELDRNARTAFLMCRAALPLLRESGGAIVNFASPAAARPPATLGAYSAGKAAVVAITRTLAREEARHGVRVNAVAPGTIDTEQNRAAVHQGPPAPWVTREQVADVVLFLVGPGASGVTGETIQVLGEGVG
jgi:NAD(P)-dependent dehydrogenase (short-subunit alcohol dehydrogenase family)